MTTHHELIKAGGFLILTSLCKAFSNILYGVKKIELKRGGGRKVLNERPHLSEEMKHESKDEKLEL